MPGPRKKGKKEKTTEYKTNNTHTHHGRRDGKTAIAFMCPAKFERERERATYEQRPKSILDQREGFDLFLLSLHGVY